MLSYIGKETVALFKDLKKDGWTANEVFQFCGFVLDKLVEVAGTLQNKTGEEKAQWVADEFKAIYWEINPDIPKIPNWIETPIEKIVINGMLPIFIKMAYNKVFKSDQLYNIRESVNGVEYLVNPIPQN